MKTDLQFLLEVLAKQPQDKVLTVAGLVELIEYAILSSEIAKEEEKWISEIKQK